MLLVKVVHPCELLNELVEADRQELSVAALDHEAVEAALSIDHVVQLNSEEVEQRVRISSAVVNYFDWFFVLQNLFQRDGIFRRSLRFEGNSSIEGKDIEDDDVLVDCGETYDVHFPISRKLESFTVHCHDRLVFKNLQRFA